MIFDLVGGDPEKMIWIGENITYPEAQEMNCFRAYDNWAQDPKNQTGK